MGPIDPLYFPCFYIALAIEHRSHSGLGVNYGRRRLAWYPIGRNK